MPKMSIVLPTFNGALYIRDSIDSIRNQTFHDWELIIVDDCSTDETPEIIRSYLEIDDRIHVVRNYENQKLPRSLNIGFSYASGDFLTWTSDDNYYLPTALETMYDYLSVNEDEYMVCTDMDIVDDSGNKISDLRIFSREEMFYNNCVGACFLYRRKVLEELGGYNTEMFLTEDYEYWMRILKHYGMIGHIPEVLYQYRIHKGSLTSTKYREMRKKLSCFRKDNIDWILDNLRKSKSYISLIYYELLAEKEDIDDIEKKFFDIVPELEIDHSFKKQDELGNKRFIIWGAGNYGERAANYLNEQVEYFVDSNISKVGHYKCGVEIISKEQLLQIYQNYHLLIAMDYKKLFDILQFLYQNGIRECFTYQKFFEL